MTAAMMFEAGDHSYVYAHVLKQTLKVLRHNASLTLTGSDGGVDLLRVDSLLNLGEPLKAIIHHIHIVIIPRSDVPGTEKMRRVLAHNYVLLLSLVPFASEALTVLPLHLPHSHPI